MDSSLDSVYWSPEETDVQSWLEITFEQEKMLNTIILGEAIQQGQHLEMIEINGLIHGDWKINNKSGFKRL